MKLAVVAAIARNRAIGKDGKLPWHLSDDLKRFKRLTSGHTVLMGRRTFESIGKPLPHRRNVVVSSRAIPGIETYPTVAKALEALHAEERVFVIGGGVVYAEVLARADELYLTLVRRDVDGDTFFPPYAHLLKKKFRLVSREDRGEFVFEDYVRSA